MQGTLTGCSNIYFVLTATSCQNMLSYVSVFSCHSLVEGKFWYGVNEESVSVNVGMSYPSRTHHQFSGKYKSLRHAISMKEVKCGVPSVKILTYIEEYPNVD